MLNNQSEAHLSIQKIQDVSQQEKPGVFLQYCREIIDAKNKNELSIEDAGYRIAEAMFIHDLDEPLFDEIVALAGSLELPFRISGVESSDGWNRLVTLIEDYDRRLQRQ
jgi:hypothetical protein